jgi:UDP-glucose 4-epimerase
MMIDQLTDSDFPVVVIGAAGFIGGTVFGTLLERNIPVVGLDIKRSDYNDAVQIADILELDQLTQAIPENALIVHLAGPVAGSFGKGLETAWRLQVEGTGNVLIAAARKNARRLVFGSSYHVYMPFDATDSVDEATRIPASDMDPFGSAKLVCEHTTSAFCAHAGIDLVTLRFGSVYGLGNCSNLMGELFEACKSGKNVEIWGAGERTNHYVDLDDLADGCIRALSVAPGLYNVLDPRQFNIREICEIAESALGVKSTFRTEIKERPSFPKIAGHKFIDATGWRPTPMELAFERKASQIQGQFAA